MDIIRGLGTYTSKTTKAERFSASGSNSNR
jgi:hypothetical protein